ncbi:extracellular solute-binding protein [Paenibacillus sp. PL2-23]|uniref:extracellular solute-binding protein n=1 Tax=Paenibacillus sp. PL2-23 TaxID=2100729 RepID=UPI0030F6CDA0
MKEVKLCTVVMVMIAVFLVGCSNNNTQNSQKPSDQAASEDKKANLQSPKPKIKVAVTEKAIPPSEGTLEDNRWVRWINENGPVEIEVVPIPPSADQMLQKYTTLFASGDAPDIIYSGHGDVMNALYNQKQLLPLDELIEQHSTVYKKKIEENSVLKKLGTKDGQLYLLGGVASELYPNTIFYIRMDWLKKLNLSMPTNVEELYKVAHAFTWNDPDGNGKDDTFGIQLSWVAEGALSNSFNDARWFVKDGSIVFDLQPAKALAEFKREIYKEKLTDRDFLTDNKGAKATEDWVNGKLGIYIQGAGLTLGKGYATFEAFKKNNPDGEIAVLPLFEGPYGTFSPYMQNPVDLEVAVNVNTKHPEAVMQYIDFMVLPSTQKMLTQGMEGIHYKSSNNECAEPIDLEKNKLEMSAAFVFLETVECHWKARLTLDPEKPLSSSFLELIKEGEKYINPNTPIPQFTHPTFMPKLPKDINLIEQEAFKAINDLWTQYIVGSVSKTSDDIYMETEDLWNKMNGKKVEQWYTQWYTENKDSWVFKQELYDTFPHPK